ncbi:hypothetical protein APY94_00085 [Thermococcus celericrescens]|uniref:Uncharacterized protein n=1 Tax=Thermococcus celericrescens TaxID=227598 RepID=A0A100XZW3_9EURY|nr:helix-turn-helix domain-containing protein [Thermococcus celericrescens]KUH34811.1 hypothetical protein APY94_00085 [Thermococcus celericrescens]
MTLTKAELKVLLALDEPRTLRELSEELGLSKATLSVLLSSLNKKSLVEFEGKKPLVVKPVENKVNDLLRSIKVKYSFLNIESLLAGNSLKVLAALEVREPQPPWLLQLKARVGRATLHRILNELMERLIVGKRREGYFLSERFADLKAFAEEYFYLQNSIKAKEFDPKASVAWSGVGEFILATDSYRGKSFDNFQLTGLARFSDYGLPLISAGVYHYYWPSKALTLEEVVVHALKLGSGAREILYALVILKAQHFDVKQFKRLGAKFGVSALVEDLLEYLGGVDKPYPFPSREEVNELCREYFGGQCDDNEGKTD